MEGYSKLKVMSDAGFINISTITDKNKILVCDETMNAMFTNDYKIVSGQYNGTMVKLEDYKFPLMLTRHTPLIWEHNNLLMSREVENVPKREKGYIISEYTIPKKHPIACTDLSRIRLGIVYLARGYKALSWNGKRTVDNGYISFIVEKDTVKLNTLISIIRHLRLKFKTDINTTKSETRYVVTVSCNSIPTKDLSILDLSSVDKRTALMIVDELIYWHGIKINRDDTIYYIDTPHKNAIPAIEGIVSLAGLHSTIELSPDNEVPPNKPPIYRVSILQKQPPVNIREITRHKEPYSGKVYNLVTNTGMAVCKLGDTVFIASTYKNETDKGKI